MSFSRLRGFPLLAFATIGVINGGFAPHISAQAAVQATQTTSELRPMAFLDVQHMRQIGAPTPSPDGRWLLYTLSTPDWKEAKRQTDIFIVSAEQGVPSTRQLTFTRDKNESSPRWSRDGKFFVFSSNRDAPASASGQNQLYMMRPDGGEARKITDAKEGVSTFAVSRDGRWLAYRSGKADEEQLFTIPVVSIDSAKPVQLTRQAAGVGLWQWARDGKRIYFITADTLDKDEKMRMEKKFNVVVRNMDTPRSSLWALDVDTRRTTRLTRDTAITVTDFNLSDDGKWISFRGISADRYRRNITEQGLHGDNYLLDTATGQIERLTNNVEVGESTPSFSPDGQWMAFSASDDMTRYNMKNTRVYLRRTAD